MTKSIAKTEYSNSYAPFNVVALNPIESSESEDVPSNEFIPIKDVLDILEVLHPTDVYYSHLNKAYVEKDLTSIFYLLEYTNNEKINTDIKKFIKTGNISSLRKFFPNHQNLDINKNNLYDILTSIGDNEQEVELAKNLKGAYIDKNYYSIFRLLPNSSDLKKVLLNDDYWALFRFLKIKANQILIESNAENLWKLGLTIDDLAPSTSRLLFSLKSLYVNNVKFDYNRFSKKNIVNYQWIVSELKKLDLNLGTTYLCKAGYGILSVLLFENKIKVSKIRGIDLNPDIFKIAEVVNKPYVVNGWKFKAVCEDIRYVVYDKQYDYYVSRFDGSQVQLCDTCDTVINLECDRIDNFEKWYKRIPAGVILVLQSKEKNSAELNELAAMTTVYYEGILNNRYMKIGVK